MISTKHENLPAGTVLVHVGGSRVRLLEPMRGNWAYVAPIRKDGERDRRRRGWSGSLPVGLWRVEPPATREAKR